MQTPVASIKNTALLYRPSLSIWTARKKDKNESAKVNKGAGAVDGAANVHKQLLPDSPELEAIQKWATAFRTYVYANTLPWDDAGWRAGNAAKHMEFMTELSSKLAEGDQLVDAFMKSYQQAVENAKFTLNNLFDPSDYPGEQEVRSKFRFTVDVSTLPDSDDFRVIEGVPPEEVDKLIATSKTALEERLADAMGEAYERLYEVVSKMGSTLQQYQDKAIKKFNDSLTGNIEALADVIPALNLTGDQTLNDLAKRAKQLTGYDLKELRKTELVRTAAIEDANALAAEIYAAMQATPAAKGAVMEAAKAKADVRKGAKPEVKAEVQTEPVVEPAHVEGVAEEVDAPVSPTAPVVKADDPASLLQGWL